MSEFQEDKGQEGMCKRPKSQKNDWWLGSWEESESLVCFMWALNLTEIKEWVVSEKPAVLLETIVYINKDTK